MRPTQLLQDRRNGHCAALAHRPLFVPTAKLRVHEPLVTLVASAASLASSSSAALSNSGFGSTTPRRPPRRRHQRNPRQSPPAPCNLCPTGFQRKRKPLGRGRLAL